MFLDCDSIPEGKSPELAEQCSHNFQVTRLIQGGIDKWLPKRVRK